MDKYKILIADDHSMIRSGIKALLSKDKTLTVVGEAGTGQEALSKYEALKPDLIILDISLPDMNGMEVAQQLLQSDPGARIVILSMYDDEDYISRCMEYGVKGYVVKNDSVDELDHAVKTILKGQNYFSRHVQNVIFKKYTTSVARKKQQDPDIKFTNREVEIIKLISQGLTSQQMATSLFISPRTVETHRANLMKKAGVKNSIELVKKAEKIGFI